MKAAVLEAAPALARNRAISDFADLVKARLTLLVLLTTAVGFYLGAENAVSYSGLFHAVFGTALAAAGAAALNQWWEHNLDALMHRTRTRPIPAGRMNARDALILGGILGGSGVLYLAIFANLLSAALAGATIVIYLFAYTPLKRVSTANTLVGAIPGALPPLIGWAAARGSLNWPACSLFAIMFCWQMPHFFAIAWLYREDYERAGFRMLSGGESGGVRSGFQSVLFATLLLCASVAPALLGVTARSYLAVELALSAAFLVMAFRFRQAKTATAARALFLSSIIYLPILLGLLVISKR